MRPRNSTNSDPLHLRAGEIVDVRSKEEILATLDADGTLDALPFMPEMLKYCGRRFKVFKRADKTCDTIDACVSRRMKDAVHLDGLRCNGEAHGGCEAACQLFWKEAWLTRIDTDFRDESSQGQLGSLKGGKHRPLQERIPTCTDERLLTAVRGDCATSGQGDETFRCQATELNKATSPLRWWDIRQYIRELRSGNIELIEFLRVVALAMFNVIQRRTLGRTYPFIQGQLSKTPTTATNLRPGDIVQVKRKEEIETTLDTCRRNRGLHFDREMVKYCGGQFTVLKRVEKIIDEKNGKMIRLPKDCIILDGVTCQGDVSTNRLFCPRSIYPYWREIWLKRLGDSASG